MEIEGDIYFYQLACLAESVRNRCRDAKAAGAQESKSMFIHFELTSFLVVIH
jgi:hypothetical protein